MCVTGPCWWRRIYSAIRSGEEGGVPPARFDWAVKAAEDRAAEGVAEGGALVRRYREWSRRSVLMER